MKIDRFDLAGSRPTQVVEGLSAALFPTHFGRPNLTDESIDYFVGDTLTATLDALVEQVRRGLPFGPDADLESEAALVQKAVAVNQARMRQD